MQIMQLFNQQQLDAAILKYETNQEWYISERVEIEAARKVVKYKKPTHIEYFLDDEEHYSYPFVYDVLKVLPPETTVEFFHNVPSPVHRQPHSMKRSKERLKMCLDSK